MGPWAIIAAAAAPQAAEAAEPAGPFVRLNYSGTNPGAFPEGARIIGRMLELNLA